MKNDTPDAPDASHTEPENAALPSTASDLPAIPGDTYPIRTELKALGAIWDRGERLWRIAANKLSQAQALVEHQALLPAITAGRDNQPIDAIATLSDPFEDEGNGPRYVLLSENDGAVYAAKDALKAIGAHWDKGNRTWKVREEKADYARAIVASVSHPVPPVTEAVIPDKVAPSPSPARAKRKLAPAEKTVTVAEETVREETMESARPPLPEPVPGPMMEASILLGGLWRTRGADGKVYLSGSLSEGVEIRIVANAERAGEEEPSHRMYLVPRGKDG